MPSQLQAHDHAVFVYRDENELLDALARFTKTGLEADDVVVFVHSFPTRAEAVAFLRKADYDFSRILDSQFFVVSYYQEAFEGGQGRIDTGHVVQIVDDILGRAAMGGRAGARVFVDASRTYLTNGREDEWFAFEEALGRTLKQRIALVCAYSAPTIDEPRRRERVLLTHLYRFEP